MKVTVETIQKRLQRNQEGIFSERVYWQHEQFTRELFSEKAIVYSCWFIFWPLKNDYKL